MQLDIALFLLSACVAAGQRSKGSNTSSSQTPAGKGDVAEFGAAAEKNLIFNPDQATGNEKENRAGLKRYSVVKWTCWAMDYAYVLILFYFFNDMCSGEKFTPKAAFLMNAIIFSCMPILDLIKAYLFSDVVAEVKLEHLRSLWRELVKLVTSAAGIKTVATFIARILSGEGLWRDFSAGNGARKSVLHHIFYFVKIGLIVAPSAAWLQTKLAVFHFTPVTETFYVWGEGQWYETQLNVFAVLYLEYLFLSFIKDAISMSVFHQMMHNQLYHLHHVHHMPMKELSNVNAFFLDIPDVVLENLMAPSLLLLLKMIDGSGKPPQVHVLSVMLLTITDTNIHSICPYTIGFYNPFLDMIMKSNISHQLHHALNVGHYTIWPWHQLKGVNAPKNSAETYSTAEHDIRAYNKVFKTNFPC